MTLSTPTRATTSTPRWLVMLLVLVWASLDLSGCLKQTRKDDDKDDKKPVAAAGFPEGYTAWKKVNAETIVRDEEKIAREVYVKASDGLGAGTIIVKEQYGWAGGAKGELELIAVMRRGADTTKYKGWEFSGFDPKTKASKGELSACIGCHELQEDNDFLFTERAKFQ